MYRSSADLVLILHLAFVAWVVLGRRLVLRWPRLMWIHVPAPQRLDKLGAAKAVGANVAAVMRNAATNVQEVVVPNAGHWLMEEAPAATIAAVKDFLAAH